MTNNKFNLEAIIIIIDNLLLHQPPIATYYQSLLLRCSRQFPLTFHFSSLRYSRKYSKKSNNCFLNLLMLLVVRVL